MPEPDQWAHLRAVDPEVVAWIESGDLGPMELALMQAQQDALIFGVGYIRLDWTPGEGIVPRRVPPELVRERRDG